MEIPLSIWFAFQLALQSAPVAVRDHANAFSADAVASANDRLREVSSAYGADVMIEYFASVPDDGWWDKVKIGLLRSKAPVNRRSFFTDWARRQVQSHPKRIYVLMCNDPGPLQVEVAVGRALRQRGQFTDANAAALRQSLLDTLQAGKNDGALNQSIDITLAALKSNRDTQEVPEQGFPWTATLSVAGALMVLWIGLLVTRRRETPTIEASMGGTWDVGGNYVSAIYRTAAGNWIQQLRQRPRPKSPELLEPLSASPVETDLAHQTEPFHG